MKVCQLVRLRKAIVHMSRLRKLMIHFEAPNHDSHRPAILHRSSWVGEGGRSMQNPNQAGRNGGEPQKARRTMQSRDAQSRAGLARIPLTFLLSKLKPSQKYCWLFAGSDRADLTHRFPRHVTACEHTNTDLSCFTPPDLSFAKLRFLTVKQCVMKITRQ